MEDRSRKSEVGRKKLTALFQTSDSQLQTKFFNYEFCRKLKIFENQEKKITD